MPSAPLAVHISIGRPRRPVGMWAGIVRRRRDAELSSWEPGRAGRGVAEGRGPRVAAGRRFF